MLRPRAHLFSVAFAASLLSFAVAGCSANTGLDEDGQISDDTTSPITDIDQTSIKRQSIGNCWIYSNMALVEALHKKATGNVLNLSESYMTYFHWFDQIANSPQSGKNVVKVIEPGGDYLIAGALIRRYGLMTEKDFIPAEANKEMSERQSVALEAINTSLKTGELSTVAGRRDRALVRRELDKAWKLKPALVSTLDQVFGKDVSRSLSDPKNTARAVGTPIIEAKSVAVQVNDPKTYKSITATLDQVLPGRNGGSAPKYGYTVVRYPNTSDGIAKMNRRSLLVRIQKALHAGLPVQMFWLVDFNAMEAEGQFRAPPASPGSQGGHVVLIDDYEVTNVPGFGTLKAGVVEKRPEALAAALDPDAEISFIRIKNSWGNVDPDSNFTTGYHDIHMKYLNGPVKMCEEKDGAPVLENCHDVVPFRDVLLPAGY